MIFQQLSEVLAVTFQDIGVQVLTFLPRLFFAIVIFIVGWIIGSVVGGVVAQIFRALKIDRALEAIGTDELLARAGFRLDVGAFLGALVKWFLIIVFLVATVDILGLNTVNAFLSSVVLAYLPRVIAAVLVLILAAVIADLVHRLVAGAVKAAHMPSAHFAAGVSRWAIWIFGILIALDQLGIAQNYFQTLFVGLVSALALALGLSFGLGGKEVAAKYLERLRKDISEK
ncbi:MAG: hypothetical protein COV07_03265 [Candidatus Vogelbacteria bacterium CG10_big_fil_rev_8_21_14_0_10_45_14]|uniref:Small-conductance mechanosensitive ion channel n=1 Tax=Candidatus Vogelbacteria bacterium CG10_big_fil_rev_8_21_14_0_10_45_14 TaxID=1975042 RepID=A0A2H0RJP1_9BACT|nr:MAG: hypothetical protein COV07_03265 [Candidatus Vogelbacteria bacterium CG10_big_fil_rev_8_21_14_0_10_45_14]